MRLSSLCVTVGSGDLIQLRNASSHRTGFLIRDRSKFVSIPLLLLAANVVAQSVSVPTPSTLNVSIPTISSSEPVELTTHETISLSSGAVSFSLPVLSLPQRGGTALNIGFVVSGNQYALRETQNQFTTADSELNEIMPTMVGIQNAQPSSLPWGTIIHPNLPTLTADSSYAGSDSNEINQYPPTYVTSPEYCMQNWTFTDWDGSTHTFPGNRDCSYGGNDFFSFIQTYPLATASVLSNDEEHYILDASNTNDIHVVRRDGSVYHFGGYTHEPIANACNSCSSEQDQTELQRYNAFFTSIVDPNGNIITGPSSANGYTVVDTIGRVITYSNNQISYKAQEDSKTAPSSKSVSATVAQLANTGGNVAWPVNYSSYQTAFSSGPCVAPTWTRDFAQEHDGFPTQTTVSYQGPGLSDGATYPVQTNYSITVPNGSLYTLTFDVTGNLIKVQYPSGGYTKYDYLYGRVMQSKSFGDVNCVTPSDELLAKHECTLASGACMAATTATASNPCVAGFPAGGEATTCYSGLFSSVATSWGSGTDATVTDPLGNVSTHSSAGNSLVPGPTGYLPFYKVSDVYNSGSSTLLKSIAYSYADSNTGCSSAAGPWLLQPCDITTNYATGGSTLSSKVAMTYTYNNPTQIQEYDFSGNLLKTTNAVWETGGIYSDGMTMSKTGVDSGPVGVTALTDMIDHLEKLTVTDGVTGVTNTKAFVYDSRGNLQQSAVSGTGVSALTTLYTPLDSFGRPTQATDPNNHVTKYSYADSWYDSTCAPSSNAQTYLTSATNALNQVTSYKWDSCTGELGSVTDANGAITTFSYDELGRTTNISYPDGGVASNIFVDTAPNSIQTTKLQTPNPNLVTSTVLDGFARTSQTQLTSDPSGTDFVDTTYDALGRVAGVSNPYRSSGSTATNGITSYTYDALGQKTRQVQPDGSSLQWCYNDISNPASPQSNCRKNISSFTGTWIDSADESGNNWQRVSDGGGRLTSVAEPYSFETDYTYNGVGDLTQVDQWGGPPATAGERQRRFTYDSLSRLLSATNPETGAISYQYLSSGSLCSGNPSLVCNKTDARGIVTTSKYDSLNRPTSTQATGINYTYTYDKDPTLSPSNPIGRLVFETNNVSATRHFSYDAMGRTISEEGASPGNPGDTANVVSSTYDLAGNLGSLKYPDGRLIQYAFDSAGRMSSITYQSFNGTNVSQPYFAVNSSSGFDPFGHVVSATFGNSIVVNSGYNNRERLANLAYGTSTAPLWSKQYGWTTNGNLQDHIDQITGIQRQFSYDDLNRLTLAQDIVSTTKGTGTDNGGGGSSSGGGGAVGTTPGVSGEVPWLTNPDESNILGDINAPNSNWTAVNTVLAPDSVVAPDGTMTGASVTTSSNSATTYISGAVSSPYDYTGETMMGSVWLRSATGTLAVNVYITETMQSGYTVLGTKQVQLTTSWQQFQVTGVVQNGGTGLSWVIGGGGSVTAGASYFVWNPMLEDKGVAGTSVTNFAPYSQRFSTWNNTQGTAADNAVTAPDGTNTASILTASSSATQNCVIDYLANPAPFSGMAVTGSVWLKVPTGSSQVLLTLYQGNSSGGSSLGAQTITLSTTWQRFQVTGTAESALSSLVFQIGGGTSFSSGMIIDAWGAQVELASVAGPYVQTADLPVTAATTLTNLVTFSQQLDGASWTPSAASLTVNSDTAPDGTTTAATVTGNSGSTDSYFVNLISNSALYDKQGVTASVYLRSTTGLGSIKLYLVQNGSSGHDISLTKTVTLNSNWQRFQLSGTLDNGLTELQWQIGGGGSVQASQSYEVWGAQVELNSKAGPYVATSDTPIITGGDFVNILPNSQLLTSSSWAKNQTSVTVNGDTAPDTTQTAAIVATTTSTTDGYVADYTANPSLYDGETVTASVYLRSTASIPPFNIYLSETGDNGFNPNINQKVTLTSSWQRFELTGTLDNGLTELAFQLGGGGTITGTQSFEVWGPRLDIGSAAGPDSVGTGGSVTNVATGQPGALVAYGLNQAYTYDAFGNLEQNASFGSSFSASNQMLGFSYDAAGNLLSDGYNPITWDSESKILTDAGATYLYDASGNRIEKQGAGVTDTVYFGGHPIARLAAGQWTDLVYGPSGLLAEVPGTQTATPVYRMTDHLGNVVGNLLANGSYVNPLDYMPFGQVFSGNTSDPYMFTGKERDTESGLDYFGARYYSSNMGRFMSPDWATKVSPVPYAKLDDPQSLNLYSYVRNNPLSRMDPDGHYDCNGNECKMVKNALKDINKASNSKKLTDDQRSALKGVVSFYGKAGDHNGVTVNTGDAAVGANGGTHTDANGQTTISLKLSNWDSKGLSDSSARTEKDATVAHEGEHGVQQQDHGMPHSAASEYLGELQAYSVQSSINEARGVSSAYGTWTTGGGFNEGMIQSYADKSTNMFCGGCWAPIREGAPPQ